MTDYTNWRDRAFNAEGERDALKATVDQLEKRMRANETDKWIDLHAKAEAELARVTAEAAVMREALNHIAQHPCHKPHCPCCKEDTTYAKDALSSTSAGNTKP